MVEGASEKTAVMLDEHPLWLQAMAEVVERAGVRLVGSTTDPLVALELVESHLPDVFVMTLEEQLGDIGGYEFLRRVKSLSPKTRAIVVSADDDPDTIEVAFAYGATAFCNTSAEPDELGVAIRQSFSRSIHLVSVTQSPYQATPSASDEDTELTRRQIQILRLVSEGHSNSQVARMLWITEQTVKFHLSNIYRKLEVANRTEASRWAQLHGLLGHNGARSPSISGP